MQGQVVVNCVNISYVLLHTMLMMVLCNQLSYMYVQCIMLVVTHTLSTHMR